MDVEASRNARRSSPLTCRQSTTHRFRATRSLSVSPASAAAGAGTTCRRCSPTARRAFPTARRRRTRRGTAASTASTMVLPWRSLSRRTAMRWHDTTLSTGRRGRRRRTRPSKSSAVWGGDSPLYPEDENGDDLHADADAAWAAFVAEARARPDGVVSKDIGGSKGDEDEDGRGVAPLPPPPSAPPRSRGAAATRGAGRVRLALRL